MIDAELSLGESDFTGLLAGGSQPANDGVVVNAIDMGPGSFGATPLYLVMQVGDPFTIGGARVDTIWFSLVSRAALPGDILPAGWNVHVMTRYYAHTDLVANTWLEPLLVPPSAARYLSFAAHALDNITQGSIRAYFTREYPFPYGLQLIPTP